MILKKIAETIDELVKNHNGVILIATPNENVYQKCFGYADILKKIPVTINTQFLAGSVTKQFTAVAILKALWEENSNNISEALHRTINYYLPKNHPIWVGANPDWINLVTIHQLLIHSSGIPNYTSLPEYEKQKFSINSELINFFKGHELEFSPGEKFSYSNSGYYLLGILIEEITKQRLDTYLEKVLFKPLGMQSSFLPMHGTVDDLIRKDARFTNLARGFEYEITTYHPELQEIKNYEQMNAPGAAGSLITTAEDLLKWNHALYSEQIISSSLLKIMLQPYLMTERKDAYYGYGIEIINSTILGNYFSHRGGIPGFRSILTYIPSLKLSIITLQNIVANQEQLNPDIEQIQKDFSLDLSNENHTKKLIEMIETKYPAIVENKKRFDLSLIYDSLIKKLES